MSLLRPSLSVPLTLFCQVLAEEEQTLVFTIPIFEPLPSQYYVRGVSDRWLGSEVVCALSFKHLILPEKHPPHTELLDLQPLPITALKCEDYELLYRWVWMLSLFTEPWSVLLFLSLWRRFWFEMWNCFWLSKPLLHKASGSLTNCCCYFGSMHLWSGFISAVGSLKTRNICCKL